MDLSELDEFTTEEEKFYKKWHLEKNNLAIKGLRNNL